ncbi:hypothetical protein [Geobacter argillaceus]|uniref:Nucleotidyltransferase substrate binding protein (TIGR01987 family) n=1 Tax=Geobacter argillaceus TaxID=345631 RepID=A0A562VN42_9BACT|nr:hypothetical protein [Geobacter argillaceus]TWJ19308.1 hypothetical protein JN12_01999 [Geobacter argillaceus]
MTDQMQLLLVKELKLLDDAREVLLYSFNKCSAIGMKEVYEPEELESFESFTGRFARLSDIVIQKIFRVIDELDLDAQGTIRDRINRAEKKGLIVSSDVFVEIRMVRNDIAHEYLPEAIHDIFRKVLSLTPDLLAGVDRTITYCEKYSRGT